MVHSCVVCGSVLTNKNISLHGFPFKRPDILRKWIKFCGRKNWTPRPFHKICSQHFRDDAYMLRPGYEKRMLKETAVPELFNLHFPKTSPFQRQSKSTSEKTESSILPKSANEPLVVLHEHIDGTRVESLGSKNQIVVVPNRPGVTPQFSAYCRTDQSPKRAIIVSDPTEYKNVLSYDNSVKRRIIVSDTSCMRNEDFSAVESGYFNGTARKSIGKKLTYTNRKTTDPDPLEAYGDEFLVAKLKEMEGGVRELKNEKKNWLAKIRRTKGKFKRLRKEYFKFVRRDRTLLRSTSQPMVHFLTLDEGIDE